MIVNDSGYWTIFEKKNLKNILKNFLKKIFFSTFLQGSFIYLWQSNQTQIMLLSFTIATLSR